ncbi:MAG: hypothetical protein MI810_18270 [Flavobacteriales bacterium]|nr:hypothetical protein [Flavobacteriales bacterium]
MLNWPLLKGSKLIILEQMDKVFWILLLSLFFTSNETYACSCIGESEVKDEIKRSDAVLTGTIISKELILLSDTLMTSGDSADAFVMEMAIAKYQLMVNTVYKGKFTSDTITIYTGIGGGDCGVRFMEGEEYIVYGENKSHFNHFNSKPTTLERENIIWTNICTRTTRMNSNEIEAIEQYKKKK